jgi:hypothetical protein
MTSRRYRWIQETPSPLMVGKQQRTARAHAEMARNRAAHPLARWRMAVAVAVEPLILVIVPLLLWGMIGSRPVPMVLGMALAASLIALVGITLIISALANDAGTWRPSEGR